MFTGIDSWISYVYKSNPWVDCKHDYKEEPKKYGYKKRKTN